MARRKRVSAAALAVRWYITPQAVHDLVKRGKLTPPGPDGLFDFELALAEYETNVQPRANDRDPATPPAEPGDDADGAAVAAVSPSYRDAKSRIALAQALRLEMELRRDAGELLVAAEAKDFLRDAVTVFRVEAEQLPSRLPAQIAALGADEARIQALLTERVEDLLHGIDRRIAELVGAA
jgi:hypothetical protein